MNHGAFKLPLATTLSLVALLASLFIFGAFALSTQFAEASSVVWNYTQSGFLCPPRTLTASAGTTVWPGLNGGGPIDGLAHLFPGTWATANYITFVSQCGMEVTNANFSVTYHAEITNAETGEVIQPGATVVKGAHLHLKFAPHASQDIFWFGTGGQFDSPYGEWVVGAAPPGPIACRSQDFLNTLINRDDLVTYPNGTYRGEVYAALTVDPPQKSLQGLNGLDCTVDNANAMADCIATAEGTYPIAFYFAPTTGNMYGRMGMATPETIMQSLVSNPMLRGDRCVGSNEPMKLFTTHRQPANTADIANNPVGTLWSLHVPEQVISYPITVVPPVGAPSAPTVTSTSCTVGTSLELAFTSTDPNGHHLRFGVDWDDDGTVDQFVPPSGYVPSGSEQSAKRTFAIPGEKHVAVMVENDRGARSEWTHYSFQCAETPEDNDTNDNENNNNSPSPQQCSIGYVYQGGACVFTSCPIGYVKQGTACVFQGCPVGYTLQNGACIWTGCPEGFIQQGSQCVLENQCTSLPYCQGQDLYNGCTHERIQVCQYGCASGACKGVPSPTAALSATPAVVIKGKTTKLSWNSANTASCTLTGGNGDSFTGLSAINKVSGPLNVTTVFTLHCDGYEGSSPAFVEKKVTVSVRPDWHED